MPETNIDRISKTLQDYLQWQYDNAKELSRKECIEKKDYCYYKGRREAFFMALEVLEELKEREYDTVDAFIRDLKSETKKLLAFKYDYPDSSKKAITQVLDHIDRINIAE